ncbi:MAG: hypothetical protein M1819_006332 [Sarea resinae]|nr:MAG: hypothetical protein M1819_006332 [Sarea resinae]
MNLGDDASKPDYDRDAPPSGYPQPADDAKVITEILGRLIITEGKSVILIGHSSGGFTATASAIPELQAKNRMTAGASGGIIGVFYVCGFVVPVGESVNSFFQPKDGSPPVVPPVVPPYCEFHKHGMAGLASTKEGAKYFFNGLDQSQAEHYESMLTASPVFHTILENDVYAALPCLYLVTENDLALPATYQEGMVALQSQRPEVDIGVVRCASGHSPHLAWTEGLVAEVQKFGETLLG